MAKENKKVKHFRILNKSKEGVIVLIGENKTKLTWEEFKADLVMDKDRLHCHFNETAQKHYEELQAKLDKLFAKAIESAILVNAPIASLNPKMKLYSMYGLGAAVQEIQEVSGLPISQILTTIQMGVSKVRRDFGAKPNKKEQKKVEKESIPQQNPKAGTFKDLPGMDKLMENFKIDKTTEESEK